MDGFALGIATGLATAALLWFFRILWSRHLQPLFDRSIQIERDWIAEIKFPDGITNIHRINLKQIVHSVSGEAVGVGGWGQGLRYRITGTFKNLLLTAQYEAIDEQRLERGSMTLKLEDGGSALRGYMAYWDNERNQIANVGCEWRAEGVHNPSQSTDQAGASAPNPAAPADQKAPLPGR